MPPTSPVVSKANFSGGGISAWRDSVVALGLAEYPATAARAARARAAAASRASQYLLNLVVVVLESLGCVSLADSAIQRRSMAASWADCRRSAGALARQARIRRASMGGWLGPMGSGSFSRIAESTLICDFPSNARRPVIIS